VSTPDGDPKPDSNPWRTPEDPSAASAADAASAEAPVTEAPVTETPVTETPVTETPVTEAPVTETAVTEAPVTETPAPAPEAPAVEGAAGPVPSAYPESAPAGPPGAPAYPPGAPDYSQAPPPQPGEQYPPQAIEPKGTDGFAIAGFVLSIVGFILLSVIFCVLALRRIKRSGKGGRGLAIAGLVISAVWVLVWAAIVAALLSLSPSRDEATGEVTESGVVTLQDLEIGDCVESVSEGRARGVTVLPCADPHQAEVVASFDLTGSDYPGETEITAQAEAGCTKALPKTVTDQADETHQLMFVYPLAADWKLGGREVLCIIAADGPTMTGSFMQGNVS
jgi:hypothetical protein